MGKAPALLTILVREAALGQTGGLDWQTHEVKAVVGVVRAKTVTDAGSNTINGEGSSISNRKSWERDDVDLCFLFLPLDNFTLSYLAC